MASEDISQGQGQAAPAGLVCSSRDTFHFKDPAFHEHYTVRQMTLRKERIFTDILLKSKHLAIPCHKLALCSASPFFYRQLSSGQVTDIMEFQDVSPDILEVIIDYIYTAEVEIAAGNVKDLAKASGELELDHLKIACDRFITKRIEPANAMGMAMFAKGHNLENTLRKAIECLMDQPAEVLRCASGVEFQLLDEVTLTEWLSKDTLKLTDEAVVFQLIDRWVEAEASRKNEACVGRVLKNVRLGRCSIPFLAKDVRKSPLYQFKKCQTEVEEARCYVMMKMAGESLDGFEGVRSHARNIRPHLVLMGGETDDDEANGAQCWCLEEGGQTWKELPPLPQEQTEYTCGMRGCVVDDKIIITGGGVFFDGSDSTSNVWQYCTTTQQWQALCSMHQARSNHGAVVVGTTVMVMGGWCESTLSSAEMLNESRSQWIKKAAMPIELEYCHAFNISNKVYVLSGDAKRTLQYDVKVDAWQEKAAMPGGDCTCSMVSAGLSVYVVGGSSDAKCYRYDTSQDTWTQLSTPTSVHEWGSAMVMGGKILLGGGDGADSIEEYDKESDKWSEYKVSLPKRLLGHCMVMTNMCSR